MYVNNNGTLFLLDYATEEDKNWASYILTKLRSDAGTALAAERFEDVRKLMRDIEDIKNGLTAANDQTAKTTTKEPTERITEDE